MHQVQVVIRVTAGGAVATVVGFVHALLHVLMVQSIIRKEENNRKTKERESYTTTPLKMYSLLVLRAIMLCLSIPPFQPSAEHRSMPMYLLMHSFLRRFDGATYRQCQRQALKQSSGASLRHEHGADALGSADLEVRLPNKTR